MSADLPSQPAPNLLPNRLIGIFEKDDTEPLGFVVTLSDGSCGNIAPGGGDLRPQHGDAWIVDDVTDGVGDYPEVWLVTRLTPIPGVVVFLRDKDSPCGVSAVLQGNFRGVPGVEWAAKPPRPYEFWSVKELAETDGFIQLAPILRIEVCPACDDGRCVVENAPPQQDEQSGNGQLLRLGDNVEVRFNGEEGDEVYCRHLHQIVRPDPAHPSTRQRPPQCRERWAVRVTHIDGDDVFVMLCQKLGGRRRNRDRSRRRIRTHH